MKASTCAAAAIAAFVASCAVADAPVPSAATLSALEKGVIAIVHFGPNTFTGREWGYGDTPASVFNPSRLDAAQWVAAAKSGGVGRVILVCKHHDGFCLWPSVHNSDYTVANTPWRGGKGDLVREVRDACEAAGVEFGAYLSPWDRHHADYARPEYVEYFHRQWAELMDGYGPISEIWLDGANGGDGWYGGACETRKIPAAPVYYDHPRLLKALAEKQPLAAVFGMDTDRTLRWPGNERGFVPEGYDLVHGGMFQPPEADTPLRSKWFWHPGDRAKSLKELTDRYMESVGRSGILDLGLAPNRDGLLDEGDVERLAEFGGWVRTFNSFNAAHGVKPVEECDGDVSKWTWTLPAERPFDALDFGEDVRKGIRVRSWKAFADGREIARGGQVGYRRIVRLAESVTAREVRIEAESDGRVALHLALRTVPPQDGTLEEVERPGCRALSFTRLPAPRDEFIADFGGFADVGGFAYTPGPGGVALPKGYKVQVSDGGSAWRDVGVGEFGNIKANPIRQDIAFERPVRARRARLVALPFIGEMPPDWCADGAKVEFMKARP